MDSRRFSGSMFAIAAMVAIATTAFAYDRDEPSPHAAMMADEEGINPGIDFMITGPTGPSKAVASETIRPTRKAEQPVRRRMNLE